MILYDSNLKIYYSTLINNDNLFSGFGTKLLGDGRKPETILDFFSRDKIKFKKIIIPEQIHSENIQIVERDPSTSLGMTGEQVGITKRYKKTDGLITQENGLVLTVITADCVPIVFTDKKVGIIGISHQGWKGSQEGLAQKMAEKMADMGANKKNILAAIGPAIGDCCYSIEKERYLIFKNKFSSKGRSAYGRKNYANKIFRITGKKIFLNLAYLNYLQLINSGLKKENIDFFPFCTSCNQEKFFSYRKDTKETFGEMFSFIVSR